MYSLPAADSLVEVVVKDEERDLWQIYLDRRDFVNAFRRCSNQVLIWPFITNTHLVAGVVVAVAVGILASTQAPGGNRSKS